MAETTTDSNNDLKCIDLSSFKSPIMQDITVACNNIKYGFAGDSLLFDAPHDIKLYISDVNGIRHYKAYELAANARSLMKNPVKHIKQKVRTLTCRQHQDIA